jgi:UDP-N-acetylglucosamine 1-carboxyvinyltransferase
LTVSGAKNSALVLMAACLLSRDTIRLRNVPPLTDITAMGEMLSSLGAQVVRMGDVLELTGDRINNAAAPYELVNSLRASFFCIGPLLARMGMARVPLPGGCQIGTRPVVRACQGSQGHGGQGHHRAWCGQCRGARPQPSSQGRPHPSRLPQRGCDRNPDDGRRAGRR